LSPPRLGARWPVRIKPEITPLSTETATSPRIVWEEPNAVQIRVSLDGVEPAIYRHLVVPLGNTLAQLHHILQAAMGWADSHLHQLEIGGLRFGDPELLKEDMPDDFQQAFDSTSVRLRDFHFDPVAKLSFVYLYDFGDSWQHTVTLEKRLAVKPAPETATCTEGARAPVHRRMSVGHTAVERLTSGSVRGEIPRVDSAK
jgi:hypothetical protein